MSGFGSGGPVVTEGGIAGRHTVSPLLPAVLSPTHEDKHNVLRAPLIPIACWRVEDLRFEFASSIPTPDITGELRNLGKLIEEHPDCPLSVFGHADPVGEDTANKDLSGRRALAIYALLVRDPDLWEQLFRRPSAYDDWTKNALQIMLDHVTGTPGQSTAEHRASPGKRRQLFTEYMAKIVPSNLPPLDKKKDFLARGVDPGGKGDFQGCSEFNPVLVFSQRDQSRFDRDADKSERNRENAANRRVMVLIFRKGSRVDPSRWPCPRASEGIAGCRKRFWSDGDDRRGRRLAAEPRLFPKTQDTFGCRFYDRITDRSPCEHAPPAVETALHMHVDADRDGAVDDDRTGFDTWEFGTKKKGAVILCNNDGDGAAARSDNEDDVVNAGNDLDELAPLVIRRTGPAAPADWKATLSVSAADKDRIRIFERRATGAREIIGPRKGATFTFPDLLFPQREFGMEAVRYAGKDFDGLITITFTVVKGAAGTDTETAKVRVAPWMMPNHLDRAEKVFVVDMPGVSFPDTSTSPPGRIRDTNARYLADLERLVSAAGCTLQKHRNRDQWMQDVMEFGFGNLPVSTGYRVVGRSPQVRELAPFPKTLRAADFGYHEPGDAAEDTTFDSCGNLECTPPVTSKAGKKFPFGRMYFGAGRAGEAMDADYVTFLDRQIVQTPIRINTNWLFVGHVDEIISFVPAPGDKGFKLLLASPRVAYAILDANEATNGLSHMLVGRFFPLFRSVAGGLQFVRWREGELAIQTFLRVGHPPLAHTAGDLRAFNDTIQGIIDSVGRQLQSELGLEASDIVHLPSLYVPNDDFPDQADALTAGVVNMLVLNKHCIVPKPFGPVVGGKDLFEEDVRAKLEPLGLTVNFLDDWFEYHVLSGEVHCSSNTLRTPKAASWWEFNP